MLSLSRREKEIMTLAMLGHTTQCIADEIGITRQTVRDHFKHIYSKLGVHSRTQAVLAFQSRKS